MTRNQEIFKVVVSENIVAIANCIRQNWTGSNAGPQLIEWCQNNQDKLDECGFHNYNCSKGEVTFDSRKEEAFDKVTAEVRSLKLR